MSSSQASLQSPCRNKVEAHADGPWATGQTLPRPVTDGSGSHNDASISSNKHGHSQRAQSATTAASMPHWGVRRMSKHQGDDPTYRLVQDCAAAASVVMLNMGTKTQALYDEFDRQYKHRNEEWRKTLQELEDYVLKYYGFIQSSIAVESLEAPGRREFKRFQRYWPGMKAEGFKLSGHKFHWKRLNKPPGHSELAREVLDAAPAWLLKLLNGFARVDSDEGRDVYDDERLTTSVAIIIILTGVLLCSVPTILLAVEVVSSKSGRVAIVVVSDLLLGFALIWSGVEVPFALAVTMAYSAVLVNVDV